MASKKTEAKTTTKTTKTAAKTARAPKAKASTFPSNVGKYCVVRTYSAGVHAGVVTAEEGTRVHLKDSRRLWVWYVADPKRDTLSGVALDGLNVDKSNVAPVLADLTLTQAIEVIPCTTAARTSIEAARWNR